MLSLLHAVFVAPFLDMAGSPTFLAEVLIGGIAAGLMYSLVALGFLVAGTLLTIGGFAYRWYANRQKTKLEDALDPDPVAA